MQPKGERTALYRFFAADDRLLYVGITDRLGERWSTHMREKPWWSKVRRQTTEWCDSREAAATAEIAAIKDERPLHNVQHAVPETPPEVRLPKFLILTLDSTPGAEAHIELAVDGAVAHARDLLNDIEAVMNAERMRISQLPALLRELAPHWKPYEDLTGIQVATALKRAGVRVTKTGNVPRLDRADLLARRAAA
jgi:predicted GIY-YIG superfamily endonuclease